MVESKVKAKGAVLYYVLASRNRAIVMSWRREESGQEQIGTL